MSIFFDSAFNQLMYWEGGGKFHKVEGDAGGATNYGISLRFLKNLSLDEADLDNDGHITENDIKALTEEKARGFYLKHFWIHYQLGYIESEAVAVKLLNIFVNMRGKTAALIAQRALASCHIHDVKEDGYLGPLSFAAINGSSFTPSLIAMYLASIRAHQECVYRLIVAKNESQRKFLNGWLRRARDQRP
jgi:lysozyme family protein